MPKPNVQHLVLSFGGTQMNADNADFFFRISVISVFTARAFGASVSVQKPDPEKESHIGYAKLFLGWFQTKR
jgi:hypothetical protein